ncbi:hypothetical protein I3843_07G112600 [Carya illinoinensis]|uniref:Uncharacterized protein n=1 Tax=Carya illinoinensis TaxID=32201 RepID=A0A922EHY7_CARIL|nr:hypothetical protein I3760_07G113000 [Carya illinoinensis]KAG6704059.1 hypothetical protein I3842_07G117200 [Carya illinoinensis]KAG7970987.1 hypothetical protein I3843_07G112600 [Carya illinoinensis]
MATEKENAEISNTKSSSIGDSSTEQSANRKRPATIFYFGKALAHRALHGPSSRRTGSRNVRTTDIRTLPSRLSKVSLADDQSTVGK